MKLQILLATRNGEKFIGTQLDSLIAQQHRREDIIEILISDDGSTDSTMERVREYQSRYPSMIRILPQRRSGSAAANFIRLAASSDGDLVFFCDQDDYWMPDKVQRMAEAFTDEDMPQLVYSDAYIADQDLKIIPCRDDRLQTRVRGSLTLEKLLVQNYIMGCTIAVNRPLVNGVCRDEYPRMQMHDWWLAIYAASFGSIRHLPIKLMKYRQHGDNAVGARDLGSMSYIFSHLDMRRLRESCGMLIDQAAGFYGCYGDAMTPAVERVFRDFIDLRKSNKLRRICTQIRGGYLKSTLPRVIGQLLCM